MTAKAKAKRPTKVERKRPRLEKETLRDLDVRDVDANRLKGGRPHSTSVTC